MTTAFVGWDTNKNLSSNNFLPGYTTTATAAATTTLLVTSTEQQYFTGATTQTVVLPVTSTLVLGQSFTIVNNSSGVVTVQSSGANTIRAMAAGTVLTVTCILTSGTGTASWNAAYSSNTLITTPVSLANGGTNASLTASNGGIFYSSATAGAILSGTSTAGQMLQSGASTTPGWSTATYPASTTVNQILYSSASNVVGGISAVVDGVLISNHAAGVPSWLANGTAGFVLTAQSAAPPAWAAAPTSSPSVIFSASKSANTSNATGDGTAATVIYDTVQQNTGSAYNSSTGVFTAPTTGVYSFSGTTFAFNIGVAHTSGNLTMQLTTGAGITYSTLYDVNPAVINDGGSLVFSWSKTVFLTATNTFLVFLQYVNSTKTVGIAGAAYGGGNSQATNIGGFSVGF